MATHIAITKFARALADFINLVCYRKESFILLRGKRAVAEIRPVTKNMSLEDLSILLRSNRILNGDESMNFLDDVRNIKKEASKDKGKDKWEF